MAWCWCSDCLALEIEACNIAGICTFNSSSRDNFDMDLERAAFFTAAFPDIWFATTKSTDLQTESQRSRVKLVSKYQKQQISYSK